MYYKQDWWVNIARDVGAVEAPAGTHAIYFDKLDDNNEVYENLQLPDNVTVLAPGSEL